MASDDEGHALQRFPVKLYEVMESGSTAVGWCEEGFAFVVGDIRTLCDDVLPRFGFGSTKWSTFLRQLNLYGFKRIPRSDRPTYWHKCFQQGKPHLIKAIHRIVARKKKIIFPPVVTTETVVKESVIPVQFPGILRSFPDPPLIPDDVLLAELDALSARLDQRSNSLQARIKRNRSPPPPPPLSPSRSVSPASMLSSSRATTPATSPQRILSSRATTPATSPQHRMSLLPRRRFDGGGITKAHRISFRDDFYDSSSSSASYII